MKDFYKIIFLSFLLLPSLQNDYYRNKTNEKSKKNYTTKYNNKLIKNSKRKLEGTTLNIYFDLYNFNYTFPNDTLGINSKDKFIKAMNNAQEKLKKVISLDFGIIGFNIKDENKSLWGIEYWDEERYNVTNLDLNTYNYYMFFNFLSINGEAASKIVYSEEIPLCGVITLNPEKLKDKLSQDYLTTLFFHQFIHLLGFHIDNEIEGETVFEGLIQESDGKYYLNSESNPLLYSYIEEYFACPDYDEEIELELDEDNNIHWPKRFFLGDIMTEFDYPEEQVLSGFTLAFLEEFEYIIVNKNYTGGLMRFGKHKGCQFLNKKCGDTVEDPNTFTNEFYLPNNLETFPEFFEPSCSSGRLSKTVHKIYQTDSGSKDYYHYYKEISDYGLIGKESTKYCPISEYDSSSLTNSFIGLCSETTTSQDAELENKLGETFGNSSFCVLSSLIREQYESDKKLRSVCYEMICSYLSLTIKIGNIYIVCPKEGGRIEAKNFVGYLLCPDYNLICTGTKLCNSLFDCIDNESEEKLNTFDYSDYKNNRILTSQNSEDYEQGSLNYGYELAENGTCPQFCMQCSSGKICIECAPHYIKDEDDKKCVDSIPNCKKYSEDITNNICEECKENFILVQDIKDGPLSCLPKTVYEDEHKYYKLDSDSFYKKCDNDGILNCETCESNEICITCSSGYIAIDDGSLCVDINSKLYYQDSNDGNKYKSCSKNTAKQHCEQCEIQEGNIFHCLQCLNTYAFFHGIEDNSNDCIEISSKNINQYFTEDEKNYYPCSSSASIPNCLECETKDICTVCDNINNYFITENNNCIPLSDIEANLYYKNDNDKYVSCSTLSNCEKCTSASQCILCSGEYKLIEGDDNVISCKNIALTNYYEIEGDFTYYRKCSKDISNCLECSSGSHCNKCETNFAIIDNIYNKCEDLSSEKYYYDSSDEKYKLCTNKITNCIKCSLNDINFLCKQCDDNFSFKHDVNAACDLTTSLENNHNFFTNDSKINYYSCLLYSNVKNCLECPNKEKCTQCASLNYELVNDQTLCLLDTDKESNLYYYDETTNRYISCSIMENCIKCNSGDVCLSCKEGYQINDNKKCEKINSEEDEENKLSTGEIVGIVFGCIGFLLIVIIIILLLIKKCAKNEGNNSINIIKIEDDIKSRNKNQEEQNEINIYSTKRRSIGNKK